MEIHRRKENKLRTKQRTKLLSTATCMVLCWVCVTFLMFYILVNTLRMMVREVILLTLMHLRWIIQKKTTQRGAFQEVMNHAVVGKSQNLLHDVTEFSTDNVSHLKQEAQRSHIDVSIPHSAHASSLSIAENKTAKLVTTLNRVQGNNDIALMFQEMDTLVSTPVKRSKRREDTVDEDSSTRAERLKAKRYLDSSGMSTYKSFLSFSDDKIVFSITSLGISLGSEVDKGLENIKVLEHNRVLEASKTELNKDKQECSDEDDARETDSDLGLDQVQFNIS
jgi:hypothetical protein